MTFDLDVLNFGPESAYVKADGELRVRWTGKFQRE